MPKRPLSAYNLFFKDQREAIMVAASNNKETTSSNDNEGEGSKKTRRQRSSKGKTVGVGFANLARTIATKWKTLGAQAKSPYETRATVDKERYDREMIVWRAKEKEKKGKLKKAPVPITNSPGINYAVGIPAVSTRNGQKQEQSEGESMVGGGRIENALQQSTNDHDQRDIFRSAIHTTSSYLSESMDTSSHQMSIRTIQQQTYPQTPSLTSLSATTRRQLTEFTNSIIREQNQNRTDANNPTYTGAREVQQSQSRHYQHQYVSSFASGTDNSGGFRGDHLENITGNPRNLMGNILGSSIDTHPEGQPQPFHVGGLVSDTNSTSQQPANPFHHFNQHYFEPLPLRGNNQQQQQQLGETMFADRRHSLSGVTMPLRQTRVKQRRITVSGDMISSNEEYIRRLTTNRSSLSLSPAVGTWFERNTDDIYDDITVCNNSDDTEPNQYSTRDGNLDQKLPGRPTSTTKNRHPQDEGGDPTPENPK